ncbi:protein kinase [Archangium gephyra]|uniref:serine/threonine protein kinase n=1 Tax=Archangium gephyra TaxID=48 RepID=UPI0035D44DE7
MSGNDSGNDSQDPLEHEPAERSRPILFSHGDTDYLRLQKLANGPNELKRFLCLPRTGGREGPLVEVVVLEPDAHWKRLARLKDVAALGARLSHPAIPRTHGLFRHGDFRYLVTEYVSGISLNMAGHYGCVRQRNLSEAFMFYVASEAAGALSYVHTLTDEARRPLGVLHRGVDPYNLIVRHDGAVMLANFMSAFSRLAGREPTSTCVLRGEIDFAAPERLYPMADGVVDARSDLFSLGLVMLEMTTGQQLYGTDQVEQAAAELPPGHPGDEGGGPWLSEQRSWTTVEEMARRAAAFRPEHIEHLMRDVSAPMRRILHKLLRRLPSERYPSAAALKADLDACLGALGRPYGAREALAELLEARREAESGDGPIELVPSDENERRAGELHLAARD